MKKTLLLSVVASTMIMAGGDIAPVEPVATTPVGEAATPVGEAATSDWKFNGQAVAFTQTVDQHGEGSLFDEESTYAAIGVQMTAVNKDIVAGIGAGLQVTGIHADTGDAEGFYGSGGDAGTTSGGITQAYLTYGLGNTSLKVGRQELPKSLSPFAFSEGWQMFKNTFDAALVVNTDVPDTTLVYAAVVNSNRSIGNYADEDAFNKINDNGDVVHMLTAQNKSIKGLTLTGTYYLAPEFTTEGDLSVIWGDAKFKISNYTLALQGGKVLAEDLAPDYKDTTAFGAKIGAKFGIFGACAAYSSVDEGTIGITNLGTGIKSPLYTQMVLNNVGQLHASDSDYLKLSASVEALGGKFIANYGMALEKRDGAGNALADGENPTEIDLMYKTKIGNMKLFAAYILTDPDKAGVDTNNFVRVWARYSF